MGTLTASLQHDLDADVAIITFAGGLTLRDAPTVRAVLLKCRADYPSAIVVDLRDVEVISPVALMVLPAVAGRSDFRPDVSLLVCMSQGALNNARVRASLGPFPVYASTEDALVAAMNARHLIRRREFSAPADLDTPQQARHAVREACVEWGLGHLIHIAELVASELVTNAVIHARTQIALEVLLRGDFLHLRVRDGSTVAPQPRAEVHPEKLMDTGGRGLHLIDVYASGWGYVLSGSGKVVWATLRARPLA